MKGDKTKFQNLNDATQGYVKFGDGSKVKIEGKGFILFHCKNGENRLLQMYTTYQSYVATSLPWANSHRMVIGF